MDLKNMSDSFIKWGLTIKREFVANRKDDNHPLIRDVIDKIGILNNEAIRRGLINNQEPDICDYIWRTRDGI